jgi:uncharacterized protein
MVDAPNLYLDISLMVWSLPGAPESLVSQFRDWILAGLTEKMLYGSDSPSVLGILMGAINARRALHLALQGMIDDGLLTEDQAFSMAELVLRGNAKRLYPGKL